MEIKHKAIMLRSQRDFYLKDTVIIAAESVCVCVQLKYRLLLLIIVFLTKSSVLGVQWN